MILDLNELTLSYKIEGKNYGIAHLVERTEYKAYIWINYGGKNEKPVIDLLQSNYI